MRSHEEAEQSLAVVFPSQVRDFYQFYNGLRVEEPHLEILSIEEIRYQKAPLLHFATVNREHQVCFDTSRINEAGQWDIVTADGHRITLTMASFWSNKLWAWIDKRRHIWESEV